VNYCTVNVLLRCHRRTAVVFVEVVTADETGHAIKRFMCSFHNKGKKKPKVDAYDKADDYIS